MSITETYHFDKRGEVVRNPLFKRLFVSLVVILVALLSFGLGRLSGSPRGGVSISYEPESLADSKISTTAGVGEVVVSSQGTRYYYSHCKNSISEKNKVVFATALMAEKAGYTLALNCKPK